jgi:hypothetical protein
VKNAVIESIDRIRERHKKLKSGSICQNGAEKLLITSNYYHFHAPQGKLFLQLFAKVSYVENSLCTYTNRHGREIMSQLLDFPNNLRIKICLVSAYFQSGIYI